MRRVKGREKEKEGEREREERKRGAYLAVTGECGGGTADGRDGGGPIGEKGGGEIQSRVNHVYHLTLSIQSRLGKSRGKG